MSIWPPDESSSLLPKGFFAYSAAPPALAETVRSAAQGINRTHQVELAVWEDLRVNGKYVIRDICESILQSQFFCADITTLNANVMFELGFAIATNKRVWLIRDDTLTDEKRDFDQLRLLTTVGYTKYTNSEGIINSFFSDKPHKTLDDTIFHSSVEASLGPANSQGGLVYLKSKHDTEASVRVTRALQKVKLPLIVDDPRETAVRPLNWYTEKLYQSSACVVHFLSRIRDGHRLHNAKYALVAGLARGFQVRTLMLTEQDDLLSPIDYRDSLRYYTTPTEAAHSTTEWVDQFVPTDATEAQSSYADALRLATELKDFHLKLGEYVAENEAQHLAEYFVETTAYSDVISGRHTIFVGRKGTGKTSNLLRAADEVGSDIQNLVVLIKPVGYEIESLVRLFGIYKTQDHKGYVIESLWKFMLYSEIAHTLAQQLTEEALWQLTDDETRDLVDLTENDGSPFQGDFTTRLERVVRSLEGMKEEPSSEKFRKGISEALHAGALGRLRTMLRELLSRKHRVMLLIDNLDKPWTKSADLDRLAEFLLGLMSAAHRVGEELRLRKKNQKQVQFSSAIFLRSDIFDRIASGAREPDKLSYTRLQWDDPEMLLRVVEERYTASHGKNSDPATMWHKYFCAQVKGVPTRDYLTSRILPRPRDIVYFVKAAVAFAVNRKHERVEEKDVLDAEKQYSQYAWDSILVENGITIPELEAVLLEFVSSEPILLESAVRQNVVRAGLSESRVDGVINHLVKLTFLGLEVATGRFVYSDEPKEVKKNLVLAGHYRRNAEASRRYEINPAFRAYLETTE